MLYIMSRHSSHSSHSSHLGNLSRLPAEVRLQIWDNFSLFPIQSGPADPGSPISRQSRQPRLACLQTSHRIHDEVSHHLYKDVVLRFHVWPEYNHRLWLLVESNAGNTWWSLRDLEDAVSRGFGKLPYEKLKGIQVEIDAPCRTDPGQLVCLWKKCLDLTRLLENAARGLPNLEIHLKDSRLAKWSVRGEPQMSVSYDRAYDRELCYPPWAIYPDTRYMWNQTIIDDPDFEIVLSPFHRLRNVQMVKIYLPEDMVCNSDVAYGLETVLVKKEAFGTSLDADDPWNDKELQGDQDQIFMDLDMELDLLPGKTANMMRLERFSSWYTDGLGSESKYESELERILKTQSTSYKNENEAKYIQFRFAAMLSFNQISLIHRYAAAKYWKISPFLFTPTEVIAIQEAFDLGFIKEDWSRETWHHIYFRNGIGCFDSDSFSVRLLGDLNRDVSLKYEHEFHDKLKGWVGDNNLRFDSLDFVHEFKALHRTHDQNADEDVDSGNESY